MKRVLSTFIFLVVFAVVGWIVAGVVSPMKAPPTTVEGPHSRGGVMLQKLGLNHDPNDPYGWTFTQPHGAYFVEVGKKWLYVVPDRVCRSLNASEQRKLRKELKKVNAVVGHELKHMPVYIDGQPVGGEKPEEIRRKWSITIRLLKFLSVPSDVQEYLHQVRGIPLVPDRLPVQKDPYLTYACAGTF